MKLVSKTLIFNTKGEILVLKRSASHPYYANQFDFPGGTVEPGESPKMAAEREIQEEIGISVRREDFKLVYEKRISPESKHLVYQAKLSNDNLPILLSWEHQSYAWMSVESLLNTGLPLNMDLYFLTVCEYLRSKNRTKKQPIPANGGRRSGGI